MKGRVMIALVAALFLCAGAAHAGLCERSISGAGLTLELLGEQLLVLESDGGYVGMVVGYYAASNGMEYTIDCSHSPANYVTAGQSA